jgi:prepilin-type N-terminal cleavage/methylation domain-containing protein
MKNGFTLIEIVVTLLVISLVLLVSITLYSVPTTQARLDVSIARLDDAFRQVSAACLPLVYSGGAERNCTPEELRGHGLTFPSPSLPTGSDVLAPTVTNVTWDGGAWCPGGGRNCVDASNTSSKPYGFVIVFGVSDGFCKAYNLKHGLGNTILPTCAATSCAAWSPTANSNVDIPLYPSHAFCVASPQWAPGNAVFYNTGLPGYR